MHLFALTCPVLLLSQIAIATPFGHSNRSPFPESRGSMAEGDGCTKHTAATWVTGDTKRLANCALTLTEEAMGYMHGTSSPNDYNVNRCNYVLDAIARLARAARNDATSTKGIITVLHRAHTTILSESAGQLKDYCDFLQYQTPFPPKTVQGNTKELLRKNIVQTAARNIIPRDKDNLAKNLGIVQKNLDRTIPSKGVKGSSKVVKEAKIASFEDLAHLQLAIAIRPLTSALAASTHTSKIKKVPASSNPVTLTTKNADTAYVYHAIGFAAKGIQNVIESKLENIGGGLEDSITLGEYKGAFKFKSLLPGDFRSSKAKKAQKSSKGQILLETLADTSNFPSRAVIENLLHGTERIN